MNLFSSGDTAGAKGEEKKTEASLFPQVGAQIMVGNLKCEPWDELSPRGIVEVRPTFFKVTLPHLVAGSQVAAEKDDGNCATTMNLIGTNGGLVFVGLRFPIVAAGDGKSTFAVWFITQGKLIQYVRTADSSYQYEWSGHYSIPISSPERPGADDRASTRNTSVSGTFRLSRSLQRRPRNSSRMRTPVFFLTRSKRSLV